MSWGKPHYNLKGKTKYQMDLVGVFQQGPFFVYEVEIG